MEQKNEIPSVEIRTEKVQEILGHIPNWIVRRGTLTFFLVVGFLVIGSYLFKYPHIVEAENMRVTTENPPSNAIARTNGRIMKLFVSDNQYVQADAVLAIIENTANFDEIRQLASILNSVEDMFARPDSIVKMTFPVYLRLGEVQDNYSSFLKNFEDLKNFTRLDYHNQKVKSLEAEIERFNAYSWTLKKQSKILSGERELARNQFLRDSLVYRQGVIPEAEYEKSKSAYLQKQREYEESRSLIVKNDIEIGHLNQEILDLKLQRNNELDKLQLGLRESYENLVAAVADWDQKFVLRTNVAGVVSLTRIRSENENVVEGDLVMTVIPEDTGDIIGKLELPVRKSGKVKVEQDVNVKFENYPYMEYGIVRGRVRSISQVTDNNAYSVLIDFPEGLQTNYGSNILFTQDMRAVAEIITNEESFLERIINPVKSVIMRQKELRANQPD